eukprot:14878782-Alexandrium_andersonii.AAC.1
MGVWAWAGHQSQLWSRHLAREADQGARHRVHSQPTCQHPGTSWCGSCQESLPGPARAWPLSPSPAERGEGQARLRVPSGGGINVSA